MLVITTKSPYAVRALAELARRGQPTPVPIGEIARSRDIPVQFLEGLFATLRRSGILQSQRGVKGGYSFAKPPSEITVLEVVQLLEGELGTDAEANGAVWSEAVDAVKSVLSATTIAEVADREAQAAGAQLARRCTTSDWAQAQSGVSCSVGVWLRSLQIYISDSHVSYFVLNMVAVLAELRAAVGVLAPAGIGTVTGWV